MDFQFILEYNSFFLNGAKITLMLALFTVIFGVMLGVLLALLRISKNKVLKSIASVYIEFIRGTPLLVQLYIISYGLPMLGIQFPKVAALGSDFPDFMAGIITLSINSSAYVAEIIRSGIQSIDKGQIEAARSLGLTHSMSMRNIIIPQALKNIIPTLGNEFITIIKESSIVSVIGIHELMYNTQVVSGTTFKPFAPLIVAAFIYFIMTFSTSKLLALYERRLSISD